MRSRDEIKSVIRDRLRREFPTDTVDVTDGARAFDSVSLRRVVR